MHLQIVGEITHVETFATGSSIREIARLRKLYRTPTISASGSHASGLSPASSGAPSCGAARYPPRCARRRPVIPNVGRHPENADAEGRESLDAYHWCRPGARRWGCVAVGSISYRCGSQWPSPRHAWRSSLCRNNHSSWRWPDISRLFPHAQRMAVAKRNRQARCHLIVCVSACDAQPSHRPDGRTALA